MDPNQQDLDARPRRTLHPNFLNIPEFTGRVQYKGIALGGPYALRELSFPGILITVTHNAVYQGHYAFEGRNWIWKNKQAIVPRR
jgi:hypothetical protein